jgi:outer membrane protein TolC
MARTTRLNEVSCRAHARAAFRFCDSEVSCCRCHHSFIHSPIHAWLALIASTVISAIPSVSAAEMRLSLSDAQRLAIERSRQVVAKDSAVIASREMSVAARQLPDPVVQLGVDNLPIEGGDRYSLTADFMTMRRIGVVQEVTRAEKRELRARRFEQEAERALAEKAATMAAIQRDVALAWLDRYYAEAMAALLATEKLRAQDEIVAVEGAYRAGRGSQGEVFAAHEALVGLEDRISELNRRLRTAAIALGRWIGDAASAPLGGKPDIDAIQWDTATLHALVGRHPEIGVLSLQEEIAATEARLAQANKKADWSVEATYSQRGAAFSNMVSVGVSIPWQWDRQNRQDRELASKLAMVEEAKAQREERLRAHAAEVRAMIAEWENVRERGARYERELIPLATERVRAVLAAYQGGKGSLADVLLARRNEIDVRMQALRLKMEKAKLWAMLNFLFVEERATP